MEIPINDEWRIKSDEHAWIVQRKGRRMDEEGEWQESWTSKTWHGTCEQAVNSLAQKMLRDSDASTLPDALAAAKNVATVITGALTPVFDVKERTDEDYK